MYATTASAQNVVDAARFYGVQATGEVVTEEYHQSVERETVPLSALRNGQGRITRVRILREMGRCDISYVHATMRDGRIVSVQLDLASSFLIPAGKLKGELINWASEHKVFAKGIGLLDESNWSVLYS